MKTRTRIVLSVAALALLAGCSTNSKFTGEKLNTAKQTMQAMKSATEWDMARQAFLSGDLEKALKAVDRSIGLNPEVPKSHVLRGRILMEMGALDQAVECLQRAETLDPANVDAQYYLGVAMERFSKKEQALDRYVRAAELEPGAPQYALAAAEMMIDLEQLDRADQFLKGRVSTFEHNAGVRQVLGQIATRRGDRETAVRYLTEARLLAPDDISVQEDLARAQISVGKFVEAEYLLNRLLMAPENKERRDLALLRARCLSEMSRHVDAREMLIKLTKDQSNAGDVEPWLALAKVCYQLKDDARARQAAARVVALAPDRPEGYVIRGLVARRAGDLKAARAALDEAVRVAPDNVEVLTVLGMIQHEQGDPQAKTTLAKALRADPSNQSASRMLSVVTEK